MNIIPAGVSPDTIAGTAVLPARPEALRIDLSKTALIIVDMQNAYSSPGGYLDLAGFDIAGAASVIDKIAVVAKAARAAKIPVVYLQNGWDREYMEAGGPGSPNWHKSNALKTMRKRPELEGTLLSKGGWDYDIVDKLKPEPGDIIILKTRYSVFFNTNIDSVLRSRGIRTLIFTGIATNICVESSLRDAFHLEYFGVALADATHQAGPPAAQEAALYNIETFFGWVSTVGDFCQTIAGAGA
jgi:ureidoacrylate peracid hydrolase